MRLAVSIILGLAILTAAFFISQKIISAKKPPRAKVSRVIKSVFTQEVKNQTLPILIETNGTLLATNRIEIYSEVQGIFEDPVKPFEMGERYKKGQLLLEINSQEFYSNLISQRSILYDKIVAMMPDLKFDHEASFDHWQKYLDEFDLGENIDPLPEPLNNKEKYYTNAKQIVSSFYAIKNLEERLTKYDIYAPYAGILTQALVNPGTLIRPGQKLGEYIDPNLFDLEVNINQAFLAYLNVGDKVSIADLSGLNTWNGRVIRINGKIDSQTQTVKVFVRVSGKNLTEGQFLEATIVASNESNVLEVPRSLIVNGNQVFMLENDSILTLQEVKTIHFTNKMAMIRGLENGSRMLSRAVPGAHEGMVVNSLKEEEQ